MHVHGCLFEVEISPQYCILTNEFTIIKTFHFLELLDMLPRWLSTVQQPCRYGLVWQTSCSLSCRYFTKCFLFQLRYLQTLNSISAENNSTVIFPVPIGQRWKREFWETHAQGVKAKTLGRQNESNFCYVRLALTSIFGLFFMSVCLKSNCYFFNQKATFTISNGRFVFCHAYYLHVPLLDYNMIISGGVRKVSVNGNNHKLESSKSLQEHFYGSSSNEVVKSDGNGLFFTTNGNCF